MFRSPPRARTGSRWIVLLAVVGVCLAVPGVALAEPVVTIADQVTGRDPLTLAITGVDGTVTVTAVDSTGSTASWTVTQPAETGALDLLAPDEGTPSVNGQLDVSVAAAGVTLLTEQVRLDASPPAPSLSGTGGVGKAALQWPAVTANGPVTYKLERTAGGGVWRTLEAGTTATSFVDRGLEADWYRYRLTASIPAAGSGRNTSAPVDVVLRVAAPAAQPTPEASGGGTPEDDTANQPRERTGQPVAAAGGIRGGVASERPRRRERPADVTRGVAYVPSVADRFERWQQPVPSPTVAAARLPADPDWTPYEHQSRALLQPITIPPPGTLAVDAVRAANGSPQGILVGLLALVAAGGITVLVNGRLRRWLTGAEATVD